MTLQELIDLLKKDGVNAKQKAIELLTTKNTKELFELESAIRKRISDLNKEAKENEQNN